MSDEISLAGKKYISSKRASELSGYTQDYIGQLARANLIDARRVGGLWYVSMESLGQYKYKADSYTPVPPSVGQAKEPESLVSFDGKDYISASRAAKMTGYHQDYVGQLARGGSIRSRQVGNRWYIDREGILAHKKEKDSLLAEVQVQSVGIRSPNSGARSDLKADGGPYLTYTKDDAELIPIIPEKTKENAPKSFQELVENTPESRNVIPIHVHKTEILEHIEPVKHVKPLERVSVRAARKTMPYAILAASALTIVIILSLEFTSLKSSSIYTKSNAVESTAAAAEALNRVGDVLENFLAPEIVYKRSD